MVLSRDLYSRVPFGSSEHADELLREVQIICLIL